ncbi:MAG TPA: FecR domain-containing protein, partial [Polyangiaceae bacterium]|nr:FecR domain-containing protein [Polyangiaceae bacterium]
MAEPLADLEELGQNVSKALEAYQVERERAVDVARRGFLAAASTSAPRVTFRARLVWLAAAVLLLAVGAGVFATRSTGPLTFTADGRPAERQIWLAAPGDRSLPLEFSDGTRLRVERSSRVRVLELDEHGASVALEAGSLHANVVHRPGSAWRVIAGPISVRVTGTQFDLAWSALTDEFSVTVREGSVVVAGSVVGSERPVRAGETLRVRVAERRLELTNGAPMKPALEPQAAAPLDRAAPPGSVTVAADPAMVQSLPSPSPTVRDDWRELARRGLLKKAFSAAEASGFSAACDAASAAELLQLGDAARLSGRPERATQALLALRTRYPTDPRRAAAAFALGKVAFDQTASYGQAAEWFSTSLREQPNGSLAREAAGRLIEAY